MSGTICAITHLGKMTEKIKVTCKTYPCIQSGGVAGAGVIVPLALWIRAAVDSDAGARGELVARGAQHRV